MTPEHTGRLPASFTTPGSASFVDFLAAHDPSLLPGARHGDVRHPDARPGGAGDLAPHATTIVAVEYADGVVMAGDRRATMGSLIASREIEKVFPGDAFSAVGIAGTAGVAVEMVRLFQLELEHYEKIEGVLLSLDGKANRLATMIRSNLALALQGLAVVPLFAGYDTDRRVGRIFSYDVTGGRYDEHDFHAVGSGSVFARGSLKKLWRAGLGRDEAVRVATEALYDAADDDSATGGPDSVRRIWPVVAVVDDCGYQRVNDDEMERVVEAIVDERRAQARREGGASA